MSLPAIHELAAALRRRYGVAGRGEKGRLLDEFCETTGMHRKAAIRLLARPPRAGPTRRGRPARYGPEVRVALVRVWQVGDHMCSKLLQPALPSLLAQLERHGEVVLASEIREALLRLSPATMDRLLQRARTQGRRHPYRPSPATAAVRAQVPIRTWQDWQGVAPGSLQADLVHHCGETLAGRYLATLTTVDRATGWMALGVLPQLQGYRVEQQLHFLRKTLPFPLRALHTDNGGEFLNQWVVPWCQRHRVALSRGRPYRKNDQAVVEQRNWSAIRRVVGYARLDPAAAALLRALYAPLTLYLNFVRPLRKVVAKERVGSRMRKRYDLPQTPYQRLLVSGVLSPRRQAELARQADQINPAQLQREIQDLLQQLWQHPTPLADERRSLG